MQTPHRPRTIMFASAVVLTLLASCGGSDDDRPTAATWATTWEERQRLIPEAEAVRNGGADLCGERLGTLRTDLPDLRPAPTEALDAALEDWISLAETIMFECPSDPEILDDQMQKLETLAAEVDAGLATSNS